MMTGVSEARATKAPQARHSTRNFLAAALTVAVVVGGIAAVASAHGGSRSNGAAKPAARPPIVAKSTNDPLIGTLWLGDPAGGLPARIRFTKTSMSGSDGCNSISADIHINGDTITVGQLFETTVLCAFPRAFAPGGTPPLQLGTLNDATLHFAISGDRLTLTSGDGRALRLHAASPERQAINRANALIGIPIEPDAVDPWTGAPPQSEIPDGAGGEFVRRTENWLVGQSLAATKKLAQAVHLPDMKLRGDEHVTTSDAEYVFQQTQGLGADLLSAELHITLKAVGAQSTVWRTDAIVFWRTPRKAGEQIHVVTVHPGCAPRA